MSSTSRHVLIIGGGLAGPFLALCLARHNIRSTIFEIRPTRGDGGGSINLSPEALRILDRHAGVYDQLRTRGFMYSKIGAYADDGEKFGEIAVGEGDGGYETLRIMRSELHEALLDACWETGGLVDVKYGVRLQGISEDENGVTALFEDGTEARGDILIGADGIHSKVRQHVLGPAAPTPIFDGLCIVSGFVSASSTVPPSSSSNGLTYPAFMLTPSGMLMTIPIDPQGKTLAWGINKETSERTREEWRELELSGEMTRLAKADYEDVHTQPVRSLLDNADDTKARIWAPYGIPDLPTWHTSRVCLIGDAAHALPPNGQGSAMAFEDAAIMARLLATHEYPDYGKLFNRFEAIRRPRIDKLRQDKKMKAFKSKSGPWQWYLKKWMVRGWFWWNNGVIWVKEDPYNVDLVDVAI